jgi:predicted component of type VI protein secretion system
MRRHCVCLLALLLAGCGSGKPNDSPEAACRRQAYNDPKVKALTVQSTEAASINPQSNFDYTMALREATQACLKQSGAQVRGGVEPVRSQ